jgi:hypothetical protein
LPVTGAVADDGARRVQRHRDPQLELARMPAAMASGSHSGSGDTSRRIQSRHLQVMQRGAQASFRTCRQTAVHRAIQCGAVLGLVNALRFASTRPAAGPSGIDDTCARHDVGYCAMGGSLTTRAGRESDVDAGFAQAYV